VKFQVFHIERMGKEIPEGKGGSKRTKMKGITDRERQEREVMEEEGSRLRVWKERIHKTLGPKGKN